MRFTHSPQARSLESQCQQGHLRPQLREAPSCLFLLLVAPGGPGLVAESLQSVLCHVAPPSVCVPSSSYKDTGRWSRAWLTQCALAFPC